MLRVRLDPAQRELAVDELRQHLAVLEEAVEAVRAGCEEDEPLEAKQGRLAAVHRAIGLVEASDPDGPFEVAGPAWLVYSHAYGATRLVVEQLDHAIDQAHHAVVDGQPPERIQRSRSAVRQALAATRLWTRTLLELPTSAGAPSARGGSA